MNKQQIAEGIMQLVSDICDQAKMGQSLKLAAMAPIDNGLAQLLEEDKEEEAE